LVGTLGTATKDFSVNSVAFNRNGLLAAGFNDGTVKLCNTSTRALVSTLESRIQIYTIESLAFSDNGLMAAGCWDGSVLIWRV